MPGLNRKGPNGEGAMTGRRMGQCSPENKGKTVTEISESKFGFLGRIGQQLQGQGLGRGGRRGGNSRGGGRGLGRGRSI